MQRTPSLDADVHFRLAGMRDRVAAELDVGTFDAHVSTAFNHPTVTLGENDSPAVEEGLVRRDSLLVNEEPQSVA